MNSVEKITVYNAGMAGRPPTKEAPDFGKRLSLIRRQRGLTQQQLADLAGVTRKMVDYYERRAVNVRTDTLMSLSKALGMSVDALLGLESPKPKPGPKSRLERQMLEVSKLPRSKQQFVSQFLDTVLQAS